MLKKISLIFVALLFILCKTSWGAYPTAQLHYTFGAPEPIDDYNKGVIFSPVTDEEKEFPMVVFLHGYYNWESNMYLEYKELGKYLAAQGYLFVSIKWDAADYAQQQWDHILHERVNASIMQHLTYLMEPSSPIYDQWDGTYALAGHSRGGAAALTHAQACKDKYGGLEALVSLAAAPASVDFTEHREWRELPSYLGVYGSADQDVDGKLDEKSAVRRSSFALYDQIQQSTKHHLYVQGLNHCSFMDERLDDKAMACDVDAKRRSLVFKYVGEFLNWQLVKKDASAKYFTDKVRFGGYKDIACFQQHYAKNSTNIKGKLSFRKKLSQPLYKHSYHKAQNIAAVKGLTTLETSIDTDLMQENTRLSFRLGLMPTSHQKPTINLIIYDKGRAHTYEISKGTELCFPDQVNEAGLAFLQEYDIDLTQFQQTHKYFDGVDKIVLEVSSDRASYLIDPMMRFSKQD